MTIAAGFVCTDGIVLCSDTQYTSGIKSSAPKLWVADCSPDNEAAVVALAGSGSATLIAAARDVILNAVGPFQLPIDEVKDSVETALEAFYEKHIYTRPGYSPDAPILQLLIALRTQDDLQLYEAGDAALARVDRACIGFGGDLGGYLIQTLFESSHSMRDTAMLVAYMLAQVKKFSAYCGGESIILTIPIGAKKPSFAPWEQIFADENYVSDLGGLMRPIVRAKISRDEIALALDEVRVIVPSLRKMWAARHARSEMTTLPLAHRSIVSWTIRSSSERPKP